MDKPSNDQYAIYETKEPILFYPDDAPELYLLVSKLIDRKYYVRRPSKHHIKHRALNYYPSTGTITIDGRGRSTDKGPDAFLALAEKEYPKHQRQGSGRRTRPKKTWAPTPVFEINLDDDVSAVRHSVDGLQNNATDLPW